MPDLAAFLGFAAVSLAVALSPGPSWAYVIASTLAGGRSAGAAAIAGNGTGILIHAVLAGAGVAALLKASETAFLALQYAGAGYLLYLAFRTATTAPKPLAAAQSVPKRHVYRGGVLMSVLNPKISLLMLALLPQFTDAARGSVAVQAVALGVLHMLIASSVLTTISLTAQAAVTRLSPSSPTRKIFRWATAGVLGGFGVRLALS